MERFRMIDIVSILGIPYPKPHQNSYYVFCPCCDDDKSKGQGHLNINLVKNVFRCPRCGVSGGMFDLYSLFTGVQRQDVYKTLVSRLGPLDNGFKPKLKKIIQPEIKEYPMIDIDARNATYSALLSKLTLAADHWDNLRNRGLTDTEIKRLGYKTTPVIGSLNLAKQLQAEGYYLSGVPGFYRNENEAWTFVNLKRGILIPVRDIYGRIQGLQVRRDNTEKRKFRWVSSADKKDGCRAEGWTHLSGTSLQDPLILTEGPMKSDIIHALSGYTALAVPGVNALTQLEKTLEDLIAKGLKEIKISFDMDYLVNPHVQNGYNNLLLLLKDLNISFGTYLWDARYKGLDDYLWEAVLEKKR